MKKNNHRKNKLQAIDLITQSDSRQNISREKKPISLKHVLILSALLFCFFICLFYNSDCMTVNQATIVGVAGSTCISVVVLVITLNSEDRKKYQTAKNSASVLAKVLNSVSLQLYQANAKTILPICYPDNWLAYYTDCSLYLQYDYLEILLQEFNIIERINKSINNDDKDAVQKLIDYRKYLLTDSSLDFNVLSVASNLSAFSLGLPEQKSWKGDVDYIAFKKYLIRKYARHIKHLAEDYLNKNDGNADVEKVQYYVMEELRKIGDLRDGKYKYYVLDNKKMLYALFYIFLSLKETDSISLCWGRLSIKDAKTE